uniref:Uncharacterized protein n=1 Tax=Anguilla anguilla TaxID=7936 RepID=A0A0E9TF80_ANGAN
MKRLCLSTKTVKHSWTYSIYNH